MNVRLAFRREGRKAQEITNARIARPSGGSFGVALTRDSVIYETDADGARDEGMEASHVFPELLESPRRRRVLGWWPEEIEKIEITF